MSSVLPDKTVDLIAFCESHLIAWGVAPTTLGLQTSQITAFMTITKAARDALTAQTNAKEAAKASPTQLHNAANRARDMASDLVRIIKGFAAVQPNPGAIYASAQIPEPAQPMPAKAPGQPNNIQVTLESSGAVSVSWDATDAAASSGGFFQVMRKLPGQNTFSNFTQTQGSTARERRMSFVDFSVPTSAAGVGVQYIMQGRRGILVGESSEAITVQFGVDGGGLTVTSADGARFKMAA